ncbi:type IV toxin-antitoxin system AbiEi family antitoxin domain-containing protein [Mesorhizobium sp. VK25A]|uniref:Type IV toxin-antitoxin system AbiEi family antitoxin domain-containing protein n=1 Tax=Mesorhizobium vachelliae TaxID=3072309 RepID=A0ABU5ADU9_9HYPH|nr:MULTISPECIES: type IV toxin-antitoxin system AbiEi family antitoxin domain-containing protein [unclassified Mesorhizobium]MDX8535454.1 type IV toxin-antitoxin system AbiEi family antitoxin domain-containing protein [Mesorhizobium sp. VK25D]MDX8548190.1 type IV toxin-antitoxin system AbiEi family antitoxin domain-containing protein [Mesorhizobium sp. VK25A]
MIGSLETSQRDLAVSLIEHHGIMRLSDLKRRGINPATLARLVDEGILHRPSRGLYERADADVDISHSLAEIATRVPKGVICLVSALQFHEITLQLPRSVWIAIGSKDRKPTIDYPPIRVARFGEKALTIGVKTYTIDSVPVRIFDPAKSIVDCFRFRNAVGLDVAMEALRMGWRSRKARPDDIARYAQALRIWSVVRPYLESTVADEG